MMDRSEQIEIIKDAIANIKSNEELLFQHSGIIASFDKWFPKQDAYKLIQNLQNLLRDLEWIL